MKAIFGVASLLVALSIVGVLVSRQMKAIPPAAGSGSMAAAASGASPAQPKQIQDKVRNDVADALQQGANATRDADKQ